MDWTEDRIPEIVRAYLAGEDWASALVLKNLYMPVLTFASSQARHRGLDASAAEDAAQEAFVVLHSRPASFWKGANPIGYLIGVVRNVLRKRARRRDRAAGALPDDEAVQDFFAGAEASGPGALTRLLDRERAGILRTAFTQYLDQIDPKQAQVLDLRFTGRLEPREIARALGMRRETVSVWLSRFKGYFRDWLKENVDPRGTKFATLWRAWQKENADVARDRR